MPTHPIYTVTLHNGERHEGLTAEEVNDLKGVVTVEAQPVANACGPRIVQHWTRAGVSIELQHSAYDGYVCRYFRDGVVTGQWTLGHQNRFRSYISFTDTSAVAWVERGFRATDELWERMAVAVGGGVAPL